MNESQGRGGAGSLNTGLRAHGSGVWAQVYALSTRVTYYCDNDMPPEPNPGTSQNECLATKYQVQDQSLKLEHQMKVEGLGSGLGLSRQTNVGGCNWSGVTGARTQSNNDLQLPHKLAALNATPAEPI